MPPALRQALAAVALTLLLAAGLATLAGAAATAGTDGAPPCRDMSHDGEAYTVCEARAGDDLRLFLTDAAGANLGSFGAVDRQLAAEGARLVFAMNAGMYHRDRTPVGLYVENGAERAAIVTAAGPGNFGMRPNGVFCIQPDRLRVVEARAFASRPPPCRHATQSGPMLLIDGAPHPRFIPGSESRFVRNGVGVSPDGSRAWFVISRGRVNFLDFATFFRDALGAREALYFDGNVSRLHAPGLGRSDIGFPMGPIVGLVGPLPPG